MDEAVGRFGGAPTEVLDRGSRVASMKDAGAKRGRLKIFFGYAAGVGKTYAMLDAARLAAANGRDVLIGCVDSHGHPETEALLRGQSLLALKKTDYHGAQLFEFDLNSALERKPGLVVVDRLAHTNAAGCRHRKRWQDVAELLQSGSDVWTTLNVQEIESLRDVVAQLAGVVVRETVPDNMFDEATEVELVDLTPDDLLRRLRGEGVLAAVSHEQSGPQVLPRGSLVVLREMAMRRVADRVGREVQAVRLSDARTTSRPTVERLLVCVDAGLTSAEVIRTGARIASALHGEWLAIHVEKPAPGRLDNRQQRELAGNLKLAGQLGAEAVILAGRDVAAEIVRYAHSHAITKIVIGKSHRTSRYRFRHRSVADRVIGMSGNIDVHVVYGAEASPSSSFPAGAARRNGRDYLLTACSLVVATLVAVAFDSLGLIDANIIMTYLLGIVLVATWWGRGPAIAASIVSVLLYNFLFTTPYYTLVVDDPQYIFTLAVMLSIALIVSTLTSRVREQARLAVERELRTESLYRVSHALASTSGRLPLVGVAQEQLGKMFGGQVAVFVPEGDTLRPVLRRGHSLAETPEEMDAALWAFRHRQVAGRGTDILPASQALYLPLNGLESTVGVLAWQPEGDEHLVYPTQRQLLDAVSTQIALALERDWLAQETQRVLSEADVERSRSALLSVVSHDLRTPLAAIAGSASSLAEDTLDAETRRELATTIYEESDRLSRLVENLLQLTRIESGAMKVEKQWQPLEEVIGSALRRVETALGTHEVRLDLPAGLPLVPMDGLLVEQLLVNLLDNAAKYSPDGSAIDLFARLTPEGVETTVADCGPGLPEAERERVFEKFYRSSAVRSHRGRGAGMGLAICRAIASAHGGRIWAEAGDNGGTCFRFVLPVEGTPPLVDQWTEAQQVNGDA